MPKTKRRKPRKPVTPPTPSPLPTASDVPVLLGAFGAFTRARIHAGYVFSDERARSLLAMVKRLAADANTGALVALHAAFAQKEAKHNADASALLDFGQLIQQILRQLLTTYEPAVRPLLKERWNVLIASRPINAEGGAVIAAELEMLRLVLGTSSLPATPLLPPEAPVGAKAKGRSARSASAKH